MSRKVCKKCNGRKRVHLDNCDYGGNSTVLDGNCSCTPEIPGSHWQDGVGGVLCSECNGTGERQRAKAATLL